jgi:hypothetical protein
MNTNIYAYAHTHTHTHPQTHTHTHTHLHTEGMKRNTYSRERGGDLLPKHVIPICTAKERMQT